MGSDRFNDDFITKLVDETLSGVALRPDKKEQKKRDTYFEKKRIGKRLSKGLVSSMKIFCEEHNIFSSYGEFDEKSGCFRYQLGEEELYIPSNWGAFDIHHMPEKIGLFFKMEKHDPNMFLEVISKHVAQKFVQIYCFKEKDEFLLVFLNRFHAKMHGPFFEDVCDHQSVADKIKKAS
ncbi:MAG: hypothetical protein JNM93_03335 [Bacteriovoracaceae bacterium]|nr:hypothetical protein [Bacteriovoracaceae bacterium]